MPAPWDRRSATEQDRVRELTLADWLPGALTYAPHWAATAERLGVDPTEAVTLDALLRFPPVLQNALQAGAGARLLQRPTEGQLKSVGSTSTLLRIARGIGSDPRVGKRRTLLEEFKPVHVTRGGVADELAIASSRADLDRLHRVGARAASLLGLGDHDYLVSAVPAGPRADFWAVHALALGSSMLALHPRGHGDALDRCLEAFEIVPATVVAVPVAEAVAWARELRDAGADVSRVVVVLTVGPPPDDGTRAAIHDAWRAAGAMERELVVRATWTPDVHRGIWTECVEGTEGLHTSPDLELLEVLDAVEGLPTTGRGDLTVTSMGWTGTTLLRFRTGVSVERLVGADTPCPACGRTVPRVLGPVVERAWQPDLRLDGVEVSLDLRAAALELVSAGVADWRIALHRRDGRDGYLVELGGRRPQHQADAIGEQLARATGVTPLGVVVTPDVEDVRRRVELLGSPFADNR